MVVQIQRVTNAPAMEQQTQYMQSRGYDLVRTEPDPMNPQGYILTFGKANVPIPQQVQAPQQNPYDIGQTVSWNNNTYKIESYGAPDSSGLPQLNLRGPGQVLVVNPMGETRTIMGEGFYNIPIREVSPSNQTIFAPSQEGTTFPSGHYVNLSKIVPVQTVDLSKSNQNDIANNNPQRFYQNENPDEFMPMSIWTPDYKGEGYMQVGTGKLFKPMGFSTPKGELLAEIPTNTNLNYDLPTPNQQAYLGTFYGNQIVFPKPTIEQQRQEWAYNNTVEQFAHSNEMIPAQFLDLGFGDFWGLRTASIGIGGFVTGEKPEVTAEKIMNVRRDYARYNLQYAQSESASPDFMTNLLSGKQFIRGATGAFLPSVLLFGTAGIAGMPGLSSIVAKAVGTGFMGYQSYQTVTNPTPENIGALVLMGGLVGAGYLGSKINYPKIRLFTGDNAVEIPTSEGSFSWKGLGIEYKTSGRPLVGMTEEGLTIGSPKWQIPKETLSEQYTPFSPTETYIAKRTINFEGYENIRISSGTGVMKITEKQPTAFARKMFIRETTTLSPNGVGEVLKFAKSENADLYGSFVARSQMPEGIGRVPHDIDVQLKVGEDVAPLKAQQLYGRLRMAGENVRINPETPTLIESFKGGQWVHAVDIHAKGGDPFVAGSEMTEGGWGFKFNQPRTEIEGIKTMRLSEQGLRKGVSTLGLSERGVYPEPHRFKDIGDFLDVQDTLINSRQSSIFNNPLKTTRARNLLMEFKGTYTPEELAHMGKSQPIKLKIYSGASSPSSSKFLSPSAYVVIPKSIRYDTSYSPSMRPSRSPSYNVYKSVSLRPSQSPSMRPSQSASIKASQSMSTRISRSMSPYVSTKFYYSIGVSRSLSPYMSKSPSPYNYKSPSPYPSNPFYSRPSRSISPFVGFNHAGTLKIKNPEPKRGSRKYSYMPDLYSFTAGIKSTRMPSTLTGLNLRPMIVGIRKRKKRR